MNRLVLIVEDEATLARNIAASLARSGITSHVANSIAEAGRCVTNNDYALVCADIQLGDGNGLDFCEALRAANPDLAVIMMTGQDTSGNRLRSDGLGAMAFMAKPFSLSRLRELVSTLLQEVPSMRTSGETPRAPCVMMYSHDTIGIGHMRRNSAIAAGIVARNPRASVLMLVGSPSGVPFDLPPGVDYIKLPSLAKMARDVWRPHSLRISSGDVISLRSSLIEHAAMSFKPDVFLADHEPSGVWNELVPALEKVRSALPQTRIVLGLREILDEPELTRQSWQRRGVDDVIRKYYDDILVYGDESVFPTRQAYGLDALLPGRVWSCGYVTATTALAALEDSTSGARVVVAGGGGRDAFPLLSAAVAALQSLPAAERPEADIVAGPLMDDDLRRPLTDTALSSGIRLHRTVADLPRLIAGAGLFVTMGGYNSVVEAVATGCPALVVPRVGPSAEQRMRAACFAARGLVAAIEPHEATAERLAAIFRAVRADAPRLKPGIELNGSDRAAKFICDAFEHGSGTGMETQHAKAG